MTHEHGDEPFPRHALVDLVGSEEAGRARRERAQGWLIGAALVLLALAFPTTRLVAGSAETPIPYALTAGLVRLLALLTGQTYEGGMHLLSALGWGLSLPVLLGTLRRLGFGNGTALIACATALAGPLVWMRTTTPTDYGAGVLGASVLMAALFAQRRALVPAAFLLAAVLNAELLWLLPAAWVALRGASVARGLACLVAALYLAVLYGSDAVRFAWLLADPVGIDTGRVAGVVGTLVLGLPGLGVGLLGLLALFIPRSREESPPPPWVLPWCLGFLFALVPGHPGGALVGSFLVPVAALGLADALQRWLREDQIVARGLVALGLQVLVAGLAHGRFPREDGTAEWMATAREHLEPADFVYTWSEERAWNLRARWGLEAYGPRSLPEGLARRAERAASEGRRVVADGVDSLAELAGEWTPAATGSAEPPPRALPENARLRAAVPYLLLDEGVVPREGRR